MSYLQLDSDVFSNVSHILIYGYGVEGKSVEAFFHTHAPHIHISIYAEDDSRYSQMPDLKNIDLIIVSPGVDRRVLDLDTDARLTSSVELFFDLLPLADRQKIIGVTGTKGKSTTVKFIHDCLHLAGKKVLLGGNYGVGVLDLLGQVGDSDYIVMELSSYQLEYLRVSPHIAGFVSLYEDHLDRHHTIQQYFEAKSHIYLHQVTGDYLVLPKSMSSFLQPAKQLLSGLRTNEDREVIFCEPLSSDYLPVTSPLQVSALLDNLGVAAEIVRIALSQEPDVEKYIRQCSQDFEPLPHRLQDVGTVHGVRFINDSQSTNEYSTLVALDRFQGSVGALILGGHDKGNFYSTLVEKIVQQDIFTVVLHTAVGDRLVQLFDELGYANYTIVYNFTDAVSAAYTHCVPGQVCLLSPAAASFGWFKNYQDRGDQFATLVSQLNS